MQCTYIVRLIGFSYFDFHFITTEIIYSYTYSLRNCTLYISLVWLKYQASFIAVVTIIAPKTQVLYVYYVDGYIYMLL